MSEEEPKNNIKSEYNSEKEQEKHDNSQANLLCTISVILTFGVSLIIHLFPILDVVEYITSSCSLAGLVLMIIARVKYPKNTFAKVLMWLYIIGIIISTILMIAVFVMCGTACISCANTDFSGCN